MLRAGARVLPAPPAAVPPLPSITSRRHPLVQACREARTGGPDEPLLLDGWHLVVDAVGAGLDLDAVALAGRPPDAIAERAVETLLDRGAQVVQVTDDVLQAMSPVRTPSGVVALARRPSHAADALYSPAPALVVVAIDVQDPGNVGALVRTADAAGATGLVAAGQSADPLSWKALRASMGSAFRLPVARRADPAVVLAEARARGLTVVALAPRGGRALADIDMTRPLCLLVGGEGPGLDAARLADADVVVTLPMRAPVESLNVAVAGALALYAAFGQRVARR